MLRNSLNSLKDLLALHRKSTFSKKHGKYLVCLDSKVGQAIESNRASNLGEYISADLVKTEIKDWSLVDLHSDNAFCHIQSQEDK